jgi:hypothetical protein
MAAIHTAYCAPRTRSDSLACSSGIARCQLCAVCVAAAATAAIAATTAAASEDERFLVKTMRKSEMKVLLDMLPAYAAHMEKHPHSLITRFFGLHKLRPLHGRSVSVPGLAVDTFDSELCGS